MAGSLLRFRPRPIPFNLGGSAAIYPEALTRMPAPTPLHMRHPPHEHTPYFPSERAPPLRRIRLVPVAHAHSHNHPHYENGSLFVPSSPAPPPPGLSSALWHPHVHMRPPPPPPILHKVWILDCKSCGTFLTNRGMKAVLLLRPTVPLYSTDALPINCSAYAEESASSSSTSPPTSPPERSLPRSCECLTQTLCCHGCGSAVGYMIVIPCTRCTSSISATNRATNGHRFVFYSSAIDAEERLYVPAERGVLLEPAQPSEPLATAEPDAPALLGHRHSRSRSVDAVAPAPARLRAGDVLYWHHLVRSGEIPAVCEDPRARGGTDRGQHAGVSARARCAELEEGAPGRVPAKRTVFAGR